MKPTYPKEQIAAFTDIISGLTPALKTVALNGMTTVLRALIVQELNRRKQPVTHCIMERLGG